MPGKIVWNSTAQRWESSPSGGGVTVDNQSDPPAEVTTLIARGATITGDDAVLAFPDGWVVGSSGDLTISGVDPLEAVLTLIAKAADQGTRILGVKHAGLADGGTGEYLFNVDDLGWVVSRIVAGGAFVIQRTSPAVANVFRVNADGAILMPQLPTANPNVAGQLWNDAGTLKVSAG